MNKKQSLVNKKYFKKINRLTKRDNIKWRNEIHSPRGNTRLLMRRLGLEKVEN